MERRIKEVLGIEFDELENIVSERNKSIVDIVIRDGCNLNCNQCFAGKQKIANFDMGKIKDIVGKYPNVFLYPLEITVSKDIDEILTLMKETKRRRVLTNGVALNEDILNKLWSYGIRELSIGNFEGADDETQKMITGESATREKTIRGIKYALQKGFKVGVYTVVSKANNRKVEEIVKLAYEVNVSSIRFYRFLPVGNGRSISGLAMSTEETEEFILSVLNLRKKFKDKIRISLGASFGPDLYSKSTLEYLANPNSASKYVCYAASPGYVAIEPLTDTDIYYPCFMAAGEKKLTRNSRFEDFNINKLKGECGKCAYKKICGGGCRMVAYALTGDFYESMDVCVTKVREKYGMFD
ncbi:MAG: radical SAM protein [Nanoarchaeota archaeon]|nr:radical SAM protein [Nanoarchaeota archaeon]